jgi:hypothetical protein
MAADLTEVKGLVVVVCAVVLAGAGAALGKPLPKAKNCPMFGASFSTNQRVDALPRLPNSDAMVANIGTHRGLHPDFGSGTWEGFPIGIPFDVVSRKTKRSAVSFEYSGESDRVRYPIPKAVHTEGNPNGDGDRHALLVDRDRCRL